MEESGGMRVRTRRVGCAALGALLASGLASRAAAHDFWIELSSAHPARGEPVAARLLVGDALAGEPYARNPAHFTRFWAAGRDGEQPLEGRTGADPAGLFAPRADGIYAVGYASRPTGIELEPAKFSAYLEQEGLARVAPGRELFSRCAKALLHVGDGAREGWDRALGMTLELVPEQSPFALERGDELPLRLFYEGAPLAGALVEATHRGSRASAGRTDAEGRVRLPLPAAGLWVVAAVHLTAAPPGLDAEWESFWASLSFVTPERLQETGPGRAR
jgi:uncharacterized GH25 family protein